MSALALPGGDQQAYAESWGTCQAATNDFPRPRSLQTSGFGHILHFFFVKYAILFGDLLLSTKNTTLLLTPPAAE